MRRLFRSHFASAVLGGLIVAGAFVVLGGAGGRRTVTILPEAPVAEQTSSDPSSGLTANDIYQRDAPGVVFVRATLIEPVQSPFDLFHARESNVSTGSGFLVDRGGDILTNYHLIDGADRSDGVTVGFDNHASRRATVVAVDPADDLAVLRVDMRGVPPVLPLQRGDSSTVRVGDPTLTIGNPFGIDRTLTSGIVSALQHEIVAGGGVSIDNVIQTDQPVLAGNSGGPLLDADGRVIGINSQVATAGAGTGQVSFAVPIDTANVVLARVDHDQAIQVAYLGLGAAKERVSRSSARVGSIDHDGPAALAGVRAGDRIVKVDDMPVDSISDALAIVSTLSPGQTITLDIHRANRRPLMVPVTLGHRKVGSPAG